MKQPGVKLTAVSYRGIPPALMDSFAVGEAVASEGNRRFGVARSRVRASRPSYARPRAVTTGFLAWEFLYLRSVPAQTRFQRGLCARVGEEQIDQGSTKVDKT